jgi:Lrp/AsnC family transcriptional regulator for asnA, asnC and gidA
MSRYADIDQLDRRILAILMKDAVVPYTEIAKQLDVSAGTIHVRMKKMMEMGLVTGSQLTIDPTLAGYDICAFIGIFLEKGSVYENVKEHFCQGALPRYRTPTVCAQRKGAGHSGHPAHRDLHYP